jgi:hypothetical protein
VAIIKRGRKWVVVTYLGRGRQKWRTFGTRGEAEVYAARLKLDGAPLAPARYTTREWLLECLDGRGSNDTATAAAYESACRVHLIPALGDIPLVRLGPVAIEGFIATERKHGASESSITARIAVLSAALTRARKRGLIRENPISLIDRPKAHPTPRSHLDAEQSRLFLGAVERSSFGSLFKLLIATGARSCEARALRRSARGLLSNKGTEDQWRLGRRTDAEDAILQASRHPPAVRGGGDQAAPHRPGRTPLASGGRVAPPCASRPG